MDISPSEWSSLSLAREFSELQAGAPGFDEWRRERQRLHRLMKPLLSLVERPRGSPKHQPTSLAATPGNEGSLPSNPAGPFPVRIGRPLGAPDNEPVFWDPYRPKPNHLNNFSFLVTGDSGAGKSQTIRVLIDAACRSQLPTLIFDFKGDYLDQEFTEPLGLEVVNLRRPGLPFNPLRPPPRGHSGAQPSEHAYEMAGLLRRVYGLGDVQERKIRTAINDTYQDVGLNPRDWVEPEHVTWPSFEDVVNKLKEDKSASNIVVRLDPLVEMGILPPAVTEADFGAFLKKRVVLAFNNLPSDELKALLAEILIIQVHGHALRGPQPRVLQRLMVFDEAHRIARSQRLETLAREGRAFGIGLVIGTQFPGDVPNELAGSLATSLFLMNSQADHRRAVLRQVSATTSGEAARDLATTLAELKPHEGLFDNAHRTSVFVSVQPHYARSP